MNLKYINNLDNLNIYKTLRDKTMSKDGSFIADSPKVINILLQKDIEIKSILATKDYYDQNLDLIKNKNIKNLYVATKELIGQIVGHKIHHNAMMHGIRPKDFSIDSLDDEILMLDNITSSENIGSIARSAAALGVNSYLLPKSSPHPYSRRALRVSMGYASNLKISIYNNIIETIIYLQSAGYKIFAAELTSQSIPLSKVKIPKKWVILMGHEGHGISSDILKLCDEVVSIEMCDSVKSFNVGVAASLMMYRFKN